VQSAAFVDTLAELCGPPHGHQHGPIGSLEAMPEWLEQELGSPRADPDPGDSRHGSEQPYPDMLLRIQYWAISELSDRFQVHFLSHPWDISLPFGLCLLMPSPHVIARGGLDVQRTLTVDAGPVGTLAVFMAYGTG
jgi:hypothetical protein